MVAENAAYTKFRKPSSAAKAVEVRSTEAEAVEPQ
jgi:hypothetical protein